MRWFRNLTALFLLGLWLPATQHCDLEAAGLLAGFGCCGGQDDCAQDDCAVVENGHFKSGAGILKVPVPLVTLLRLEASFPALGVSIGMVPASPAWSTDVTADDWLPHWQFARRAAPWPGAPARA